MLDLALWESSWYLLAITAAGRYLAGVFAGERTLHPAARKGKPTDTGHDPGRRTALTA